MSQPPAKLLVLPPFVARQSTPQAASSRSQSPPWLRAGRQSLGGQAYPAHFTGGGVSTARVASPAAPASPPVVGVAPPAATLAFAPVQGTARVQRFIPVGASASAASSSRSLGTPGVPGGGGSYVGAAAVAASVQHRTSLRSCSPQQRSSSLAPPQDAQLAAELVRGRQQLSLVRRALEGWPTEATQLALQEAADFALRSLGCPRGQPWTGEEVRCFGQRLLASHGVEPVNWPASSWLAMCQAAAATAGPEGAANDKSSEDEASLVVNPPSKDEATCLGRLVFERLAEQLELHTSGAAATTSRVGRASSVNPAGASPASVHVVTRRSSQPAMQQCDQRMWFVTSPQGSLATLQASEPVSGSCSIRTVRRSLSPEHLVARSSTPQTVRKTVIAGSCPSQVSQQCVRWPCAPVASTAPTSGAQSLSNLSSILSTSSLSPPAAAPVDTRPAALLGQRMYQMATTMGGAVPAVSNQCHVAALALGRPITPRDATHRFSNASASSLGQASEQPRRLKASPQWQHRAIQESMLADRLSRKSDSESASTAAFSPVRGQQALTGSTLSPAVATTISPSAMSLDDEFARLRQDLAAERSERHALASMVASLLKEQDRRGEEEPRNDDDGELQAPLGPRRRCSAGTEETDPQHRRFTNCTNSTSLQCPDSFTMHGSEDFESDLPCVELCQSFQTTLGEEGSPVQGSSSVVLCQKSEAGPEQQLWNTEPSLQQALPIARDLQLVTGGDSMPSSPPQASLPRGPPAAGFFEDPLLADTKADLEVLEQELLLAEGTGGPAASASLQQLATPAAERRASDPPGGSPGFDLEDDKAMPSTVEPQDAPGDVTFYRRKCLELASQVHRRDSELVQLRRALVQAREAAGFQ